MENIFISDFVDIKVETLGGVVIVEWKQVCRGMELRDMLAKVVEIVGRTPNAKVMFVYVHYFSDLIPDERTNFFTKLKDQKEENYELFPKHVFLVSLKNIHLLPSVQA